MHVCTPQSAFIRPCSLLQNHFIGSGVLDEQCVKVSQIRPCSLPQACCRLCFAYCQSGFNTLGLLLLFLVFLLLEKEEGGWFITCAGVTGRGAPPPPLFICDNQVAPGVLNVDEHQLHSCSTTRRVLLCALRTACPLLMSI